MNEKFKKLFEKVKLPNGAEIDSRFAMSPMVVNGSSYEGNVGEDDIKYFERHADSASILITGASSVTPNGNAFGYGLGIYDDSQIEGWKKMAKTMKSKGAKALVQIFHPGYQAKYTYQDKGIVYGPSQVSESSFLSYPVEEMSKEQVEEAIEQYVQATRRAMEAGFDGVEIHGANHYLIQQFFSKTSNSRTDEYGGSIENRAKFALEIVKRVKAFVNENAKPDFIVGYRISPEEIHGKTIGYSLEDSLYLIEEVVKLGIDYIHTSQFGTRAFANVSMGGNLKGKTINKEIKAQLNNRAALIGAGDITSPEKMLEATEYLDIFALATLALLDPDAKNKIANGREEDVSLVVTEKTVADKAFPHYFSKMAYIIERNASVPTETIAFFKKISN